LGLYNRPEVAAVPGDVSPTPIIIIIIIINMLVNDVEYTNVGKIHISSIGKITIPILLFAVDSAL
jgi:hypothetical protein